MQRDQYVPTMAAELEAMDSSFCDSESGTEQFNESMMKEFLVTPEHYAAEGDPMSNEEATQETVAEAGQVLHEIFVEGCCALYNDLQNAIADFESGQTLCFANLDDRLRVLMRQAGQLAESVPEFSDIVHLRLKTLGHAMEQLRLKNESNSACKNAAKDQFGQPHFRKWLQSAEQELSDIKDQIADAKVDFNELQRLRSAQQVLQLQIETEGKASLSAAKHQLLNRPPSDQKTAERWRCNLEALEHRWRVVWLASLEQQELIHHLIQERFKGSVEDASDCESVSFREPSKKRRRTTSGSDASDQAQCKQLSRSRHRSGSLPPTASDSDEDTIPFKASEYEPIISTMVSEENKNFIVAVAHPRQPSDAMTDELHATEENHTDGRWSSSGSRLQDIGYSSGESSIHEALSGSGSDVCASRTESHEDESAMLSPKVVTANDKTPARIRRLDDASVKSYYKTVPLDEGGTTDMETPRSVFAANTTTDSEWEPRENALTDSLIVQVEGVPVQPTDDYEEVMDLLDDQFASQMEFLRKGTQWRELKTTPLSRRPSTHLKSSVHSSASAAAKNSCEASSEESDEQKGTSTRRTSASGVSSEVGSHRKRRYRRSVCNRSASAANSLSSFLRDAKMDESLYMEPTMQFESSGFTENFMTRSLNIEKRKLLRKKMHRSASDHAALSSAWLRGSLAATENGNMGPHLVRRLSMDSDSASTVLESGDAHFEWDDYRDPVVDELMPTSIERIAASFSPHEPLLTSLIDEDFQSQLPNLDGESLSVATFIRESQGCLAYSKQLLKAARNPTPRELQSIRRAAVENVKKLTAIVKAFPHNMNMDEIDEVQKVRKEWKDLLADIPSDVNSADVQEILDSIKAELLHLDVDGSNYSAEEIESIINQRKAVREKLLLYRDDLRELVASKKAEPDSDSEAEDAMMDVLKLIEQLLKNTESSTSALEALHKDFTGIFSLKTSVEQLEEQIDNVPEGDDSQALDQIRTIEQELHACQDRMSALETVCNKLIAQLSDVTDVDSEQREPQFMKQFRDIKQELARLKAKFDKLLAAKLKQTSSRKRRVVRRHITTQTDVLNGVPSKSALKQNGVAGATRHASFAPTTESPRRRRRVSAGKATSVRARALHVIKDSRMVQFCVGCTIMLAIGALLLACLSEDAPPNNWWRVQWGPQLEYVNGAPPV